MRGTRALIFTFRTAVSFLLGAVATNHNGRPLTEITTLKHQLFIEFSCIWLYIKISSAQKIRFLSFMVLIWPPLGLSRPGRWHHSPLPAATPLLLWCTSRLHYALILRQCFVWISEQTAINWLVCITETECAYCAVRAESLNVIQFYLTR